MIGLGLLEFPTTNARPQDAAETNSGSMPPSRESSKRGSVTPYADGKPLARPRAASRRLTHFRQCA
jgi:hypothetical protein